MFVDVDLISTSVLSITPRSRCFRICFMEDDAILAEFALSFEYAMGRYDGTTPGRCRILILLLLGDYDLKSYVQ